MDYNMLDYYHSIGKIPDRYYYQLNNKSAEENYREQYNKRFRIYKGKSSLEDFVMGLLRATLETTLHELLDDFIQLK